MKGRAEEGVVRFVLEIKKGGIGREGGWRPHGIFLFFFWIARPLFSL